ncbi:DUF2567 domain-containing protein [Micromonospora sp. CA-263727]|uniref:DUF2567 domain-containing protein n=1 Tax=Micromonospora sp. CA-263727 TaxID=3239967 RepID=UPI003D91EAE6
MTPDTPAAEPPVPVPPAVEPVPADPPRRPGRTVTVGALVVLVLGLLGAPLGLLWAAIAPATPVVKTARGAVYGQTQPEQPIAADGWFSLLGLGFGVLAAIVVWFVLRRHRGPVGLVVVVAGALTTALVAWQVGRRVGLSTFERLLDTAPEGTAFTKPADLHAGGVDLVFGVLPMPHGNLLLPSFGAAVMYTMLAGWSRWPSLRPEPEPEATWLGYPPGSYPAGGYPPGGYPAGGYPPAGHPAGGVSSGPAGPWPAPPAAPEPPAPDAAEPPRG